MHPRFPWCYALLGALLVMLAASSALAQTDPSTETPAAIISAIREQVLYARYADAERALTELEARTDLTPAQRNEALEIRAIILIARRQNAPANEVLRRLYARDPDHRLIDRDAGPNVRAAFERVQASHPPVATVTLENETAAELEQRQSVPIAVRLGEGADIVHELRVSYRNGAEGAFERVIMRFDEERTLGRTRLPQPEGREAYQVQYFVEALAPSQAVVATLGSEAEPLSVSVPEEVVAPVAVGNVDAQGNPVAPAGGSVAEEWWFWTIIGVVVAGGAVGLGVGLGMSEQVPGGTLGSGRLTLFEASW